MPKDIKDESESKRPLLSVLVPTYNSEDTIEDTLKSIRTQSIPQDQIEILLIDGGSTDRTLEIVEKYDVVLINNERRLPVYAIELSFKHAKGQFMMKSASDEALIDADQLKKRFDYLNDNPEVQCFSYDVLISPKFDSKNFSRSYMNFFGDPFTAFVYKLKGSVIQSFRRNIISQDPNGAFLLSVQKGHPYPILDGGNMISLDYLNEHFSEKMNDINFLVQVSEHICLRTGFVCILADDNIIHTSKASFSGYLKKLQFRVINNIFNKDISGYGNVAENVPSFRKRQYLYPLYCLSIVLPLFHSIYYAFKFKDASLLAHFVYAQYTFILIAYYMLRKLLNLPATSKSYG